MRFENVSVALVDVLKLPNGFESLSQPRIFLLPEQAGALSSCMHGGGKKKKCRLARERRRRDEWETKRRKIRPVKQNVLNCWLRQLPVNEGRSSLGKPTFLKSPLKLDDW